MSEPLKSDIEFFVINKVREKREQLKLSQSELAVKLDVSNGFIGQVESPKHPSKYNLNHLDKLADIFECSPKDFLPEKPVNRKQPD
ncbi:helix-turn-helix transcriptional regulator [Pedobacter sp. P351]|uniref:helix-turn-helix domain-containing protein n=1 Tax=Pedobacter superstes TaxID=3133441 RepID=UPI0030B0F93B